MEQLQDYFQQVDINEENEQLTIVLHLNESCIFGQMIGFEDPMMEAATDLMSRASDQLQTIQQRAMEYIQQHSIGTQLKKAVIVVMLGTTVLTSFPFHSEAFAAEAVNPTNQSNQTSLVTSVNTATNQQTSVNTATNQQTSVNTATSTPTVPYTVQIGDSLWKIAASKRISIDEIKKANGLTGDLIYPGQVLRIPLPAPSLAAPTITQTKHIVQAGDTIWSISVKYGIPMTELMQVNQLTLNSVLQLGQSLQIPVHYIPIRPVAAIGMGEHLDWWTEAQYVIPIGKTIQITDLKTGKTWNAKRTIGANHSDTEPLTAADAAVMKSLGGGSYQWVPRAVLVKVDGRVIAGSITTMPHGVEYIANNDFTGHFDLHFKNSTRHKDGLVDPAHQTQIRLAAGVK